MARDIGRTVAVDPICRYVDMRIRAGPILAGLVGLLNSFRMMREPEAPPAAPGTTPGLL